MEARNNFMSHRPKVKWDEKIEQTENTIGALMKSGIEKLKYSNTFLQKL